jgi:hypothetical protein
MRTRLDQVYFLNLKILRKTFLVSSVQTVNITKNKMVVRVLEHGSEALLTSGSKTRCDTLTGDKGIDNRAR